MKRVTTNVQPSTNSYLRVPSDLFKTIDKVQKKTTNVKRQNTANQVGIALDYLSNNSVILTEMMMHRACCCCSC